VSLTDLPPYPMTRAAGCPFDPPPELPVWQSQSRLVRVQLWNGTLAWVVTRYDDQRALLIDPRISADATHPSFPHSLPSTKVIKQAGRVIVGLDNPEHDMLRRMLVKDFTIKRVESKRKHVQQLVDGMIDAMLSGDKPVDLVGALALPLPSLVICDLLGVPPEEQDYFQEQSDVLLSAGVTEERAGEAMRDLKSYLAGLAATRTKQPTDDLISRLVGHMQAGELTHDDVVTTGVFLLVAGHETTANMIALGTLALLRNPDQLARLRETEDPALVANTVEELLRYLHTPHSGRTRVAIADIELGEHTIRAGDAVIMAGNVGDRDPGPFPGNPNELDIDRPSARHHTAFGFGVHQCLGQPLARMELQVVYSTLYRRIPTLKLAVPFEDLRFKIDRFVYGVHELPVAW